MSRCAAFAAADPYHHRALQLTGAGDGPAAQQIRGRHVQGKQRREAAKGCGHAGDQRPGGDGPHHAASQTAASSHLQVCARAPGQARGAGSCQEADHFSLLAVLLQVKLNHLNYDAWWRISAIM
eukprot:scaffold8986_cov22-Prasinocladus_malaysianus.AAC.1